MSSPPAVVPSVTVGPGATTLTRTPRPPNSAAQDRVRDSMAAFVDPYRLEIGVPRCAPKVDTFTIDPSPRSAIRGARAATRKYGALTLIPYTRSKSSGVV